MSEMGPAVEDVRRKLHAIDTKSGNISKVITAITKVVDQTNHPALNATIEANKAGGAGRGFSVVASEIQPLADETAAALEIEEMIREMRAAVSAGVAGVSRFAVDVHGNVEEVGSVSTLLDEVIAQVESLLPEFSEVHSGVQSQPGSAAEISIAMEQTGKAQEQTRDGLVETNAVMDRLETASRSLHEMVESFHGGAGRSNNR